MHEEVLSNTPNLLLPMKSSYHDIIPSQAFSWVAFLELARIHRPAGILCIWFPYLFGSLLNASMLNDDQSLPLSAFLRTNLILLAIAVIVRSVGCTWNDIVDRDLDKNTERCWKRPIARGALNVQQALSFMIIQYICLFALTYLTIPHCLPYLVPVIVTGSIYPFAKRFTHYAQVVLGISLAMGIFVGSTATSGEARLFSTRPGQKQALIALWASYAVWTVIYDTIYAFQDLKADKRMGYMTMSVRFERHMKPLLYTLAGSQTCFLFGTGWCMSAAVPYYMGIWAAIAALVTTIFQVRLDEPEDCWWWFQYGCVIVGASIGASLFSEYFMRSL